MKKVLYIDMDNVLVDFRAAFLKLDPSELERYQDKDDIPGIFALMEPVPGAVEAFQELSTLFDTYILSTAPWDNPSAWTDKLLWRKRHLGDAACKRLILTHHKNLNAGKFIADDRMKNGVDRFQGEHVQFGGGCPHLRVNPKRGSDMSKMQRRWVIGQEYWVSGSNDKGRKVRLIGRGKIDGRETLFFQPRRRAKKVH